MVSMSDTSELLDLPEIEMRRAALRNKTTTASEPFVVPAPVRYRITFFDSVWVESPNEPKFGPLGRWLLKQLNVKVTIIRT